MDIRCNYCGKSDKGVRICLGCKRVFYCDKQCQQNDWPNHKGVCKKYQAVALYKAEQEKKKDLERTRRLEDEARQKRLAELRKGERPASMFGIPYDQAVAWGSTIIPGVPDLVTYSCAFIDSSDYDEEGLFRISPMKTALDSLCDKFDRGETPPPFSTINDINIVTGMLKKFIRELPRSPFLELKRTPEDDSPRALFEALPLDSRHFVQLLFYIFHKVVLNKDKTKMGHSNIMIVVPTLIPGSVCTKYYESFIVDYDSIFNPDELPLPKNWPHLF